MIEESQGKASLYAKIAAVTGAVGKVAKDKKHAQGYPYISWEALSQTLNDVMADQHLAFIPEMEVVTTSQVGSTQNGAPIMRYLVEFRFTLADGETGEALSSKWFGMSDDSFDKGLAKAATYGAKEFLKKTFLISSADDVDGEANDYQTQPGQDQAPPPPKIVSKNGQPPPGKTSGSEPQPRTPEHQTETKATDASRSVETFLAEASALGFDRENVTTTLSHFDFPKQDNGKVIYNPERHQAMFGALLTWKDLHDAIHADTPLEHGMNDDAILKELDYLGVPKPYAASTIRDAITLYRGHHAFNAAAKAITPEAAQVLIDHKLLPWRPEKEDLMLATLRNHVDQARVAQEAAKSVEEEPLFPGSEGTADPVGDELDALLMGASSTL